jgi:hypothetical protein
MPRSYDSHRRHSSSRRRRRNGDRETDIQALASPGQADWLVIGLWSALALILVVDVVTMALR